MFGYVSIDIPLRARHVGYPETHGGEKFHRDSDSSESSKSSENSSSPVASPAATPEPSKEQVSKSTPEPSSSASPGLTPSPGTGGSTGETEEEDEEEEDDEDEEEEEDEDETAPEVRERSSSIVLVCLLSVLLVLSVGTLVGVAQLLQLEFWGKAKATTEPDYTGGPNSCPLVVCSESVGFIEKLVPHMCNDIYEAVCNSELKPLQNYIVETFETRVSDFVQAAPQPEEGSLGSQQAITGFVKSCIARGSTSPSSPPDLEILSAIGSQTVTEIMSHLFVQYSVLPFFTVVKTSATDVFLAGLNPLAEYELRKDYATHILTNCLGHVDAKLIPTVTTQSNAILTSLETLITSLTDEQQIQLTLAETWHDEQDAVIPTVVGPKWSWKKFFSETYAMAAPKVKVVKEHKVYINKIGEFIAQNDLAVVNYLRLVAFAKIAVVTGHFPICSEPSHGKEPRRRLIACLRLAENISVKGTIKLLAMAVYHLTDHAYNEQAMKYAAHLGVLKHGTHFATQFDELRFVPNAGRDVTVLYKKDPLEMYIAVAKHKIDRTQLMRFVASNVEFSSKYDFAFNKKSLHIPFLLTIPAVTESLHNTKYTYPLILPHLYDAMSRARDADIEDPMKCMFDNIKDAYNKLAGKDLPEIATWEKAEWFIAVHGIHLAFVDYQNYGRLLVYDLRIFFILVTQYYCSDVPNLPDPRFGDYKTRIHTFLKSSKVFTDTFECKEGDELLFEGTECS
ncbi:uncharacterized protein LOC135391774 isoform X2 [Ornithodoros turicata]|uniref:uncharacterized protein LOC135391774 isoform X2 n=1 Tax=Ornithodoros turicata TaxID=34597 RepID=UPI00313950DE